MSDPIIVNPFAHHLESVFARWPLDDTSGTTAEETNNLYDGTYNGGVTLGAAGVDGTAVTFDGTNDYLATTTLGDFGSGLGSGRSIEFWVKTSTTSFAAIFGTVNTGATTVLQMAVNSNGDVSGAEGGVFSTVLFARNEAGTASGGWQIKDLAYDGDWHHVVIVLQSGVVPKFYIDGWLAPITFGGPTNFPAGTANFGFPMAWGARNVRGTHGLYFAGSLDNIVLHNWALDQTAVHRRYRRTANVDVPYLANWSWWTRPRAVAYNDRLYVASAFNQETSGLTVFDETTGVRTQVTVGDMDVEDDHNNGAILIQTGKPVILFYNRHGVDTIMRYRIGLENIEDAPNGVPTLGPEQTLTNSAQTSYCEAFVHGTNIWIFYRDLSGWRYRKSTDWGQTWGAEGVIFRSTELRQIYMASVLVGDKLRCAVGHHPVNDSPVDQSVYYMEIDLATNAITKADGTSIGTLGTPIDHNAGDQVFTAQSGWGQWTYDVGDGTNPELTFMEFDRANRDTTGVYKYAVYTGGSWVVNTVVASGKRFNAGSGDGEPYYGGIQMRRGTSGGVVYVTRYDSAASLWKVEKYVTANNGASWTATLLASRTLVSSASLNRFFPVEGDGSVAWDLVGIKNERWTSFTNWRSQLLLVTE